MEAKTECVNLYFKEGSSDKVYHLSLTQSGDKWSVTAHYGRSGSALATAAKAKDVPYEKAKKIFDATLKEKLDKRYKPIEDPNAGTAYTPPPSEKVMTRYQPQLLVECDQEHVNYMMGNDNYWLQEKVDGKRIGIMLDQNEVYAANRTGYKVPVPTSIAEAFYHFRPDFLGCIVDGELIGDIFIVFDLLSRDNPEYHIRFSQADTLVDHLASPYIKLVATAQYENNKRHLLERLQEEKREGAVFKMKSSVYAPGRSRDAFSVQYKYKFWATASVIVTKINDQRSVQMSLREAGSNAKRVVGNVTIPSNYDIPRLNSVIEVKYLYAYPEGSLFQPQYKGERDDLDTFSCSIGQLKYKSSEKVASL